MPQLPAPAPTHRLVPSPAGRVHLVEQGRGPLVLLVHGFPESWYSWRHQLPALAAAGYRAVAVDVRGYGRSSAPAAVDGYRMLDLVADNVAVVEALGERSAVVVGHDWGATIAATSALTRPDVFRAVALLGVPYTPPGGPRPSEVFARMAGNGGGGGDGGGHEAGVGSGGDRGPVGDSERSGTGDRGAGDRGGVGAATGDLGRVSTGGRAATGARRAASGGRTTTGIGPGTGADRTGAEKGGVHDGAARRPGADGDENAGAARSASPAGEFVGPDEFYVSYFQRPGRAESEIEPDVRGWLAGFYAALSADTMPGPGAPDPHFVTRGGTLRERFPAGRLPAWLGERDLDVLAGEFERTGLTGALNRYRNMDRDWVDLAGYAGAPITQPSLFIGGALDASLAWLADAVTAYPETLPGLLGSHILDGCGHFVQQERPEETNRILLDWLAALPA
ncbi:alpha/beta hydrolase [Streptomyces monashensis]|uniref:alpha/beta hydrolase n=1 Tax=Streptomyces monashensis TaxID=1678012 RepID=UPI0009A0EDE1|nr:alpha/beta hydrolase [Streptomyces monashensis]